MSEQRPVVIYPDGEGIWVTFNGNPNRIVATGEQTGDAICVSVGSAEPGGGAAPHAHIFGEGFWVARGEMNFTAGNQNVDLVEGGFVHIPGGVAHFPKNNTDSEAELITICAPAGFDAFQLEVGERVDDVEPTGEKVANVAKKYGIRFSPDPEEFEKDPGITVRQPGEGDAIAVVGDVYRFLATGENTEGSYAVWHATVYPGGGPPPHLHTREEEVFYLLKGELTIFDDGKAAKATAGTCVVLPRGTRHWFKNDGEEPAEMLIMVAPAGLEMMFRETGLAWSAGQGEPGPPLPEEIATLKRIAPDFGIELG